jgi:hypothetical protein
VQLAAGHVEAERGGSRLRAVVDAQQRTADVDSALVAQSLQRQRDTVADFRCR